MSSINPEVERGKSRPKYISAKENSNQLLIKLHGYTLYGNGRRGCIGGFSICSTKAQSNVDGNRSGIVGFRLDEPLARAFGERGTQDRNSVYQAQMSGPMINKILKNKQPKIKETCNNKAKNLE